MRYTQKRNGVNEIPLLNAVCGTDIPYWRIDRHDSLHSYLSGDAADKLAAYEDAEERGRLVARDMHGRPYYDRPQTNADRIRAMSDEELAEYMATLPCCPPNAEELCYPNDSCEGTDLQAKCWLNYLKQEADHEQP